MVSLQLAIPPPLFPGFRVILWVLSPQVLRKELMMASLPFVKIWRLLEAFGVGVSFAGGAEPRGQKGAVSKVKG